MLRERETMISYSREDAEQLYIHASTSMHNIQHSFLSLQGMLTARHDINLVTVSFKSGSIVVL